MPKLLFDSDYQSLIKQSHPGLNVGVTEAGLPYYHAHLPYFEVFKPGIFKNTYAVLAKKMPAFLHPSALIIGLPFEPYEQTDVLQKLPPLSCLKKMALDQKAALVIIANVDPLALVKRGLDKEFLVLRSLPNMVLKDVQDSSFFASLNKRRHGHVQRVRRHFASKGYQVLRNPGPSHAFEHQFFKAYEETRARAKVPWVHYEKRYFQEISAFKKAHNLIAVDEKGSFLGGLTALFQNEEAHLARLAVDGRYQRKDAIFFALFYEALFDASLNAAQEIHLGPTTYELKGYLGAKPHWLINLILPISWPKKLLSPAGNFILNNILLRHLRHFEVLKRYF